MKKLIYADNAATTRLDPIAFEAMKPFLAEEYGNPSQPYSFSRMPKKAIQEARETIASCIGAYPEEIFFTSGGSESDNWALKSTALYDKKHRETITTAFEHHAILNTAKTLEVLDHPVAYLCPNQEGTILPETLRRHITDETLMVSIMCANNELGSIQPIGELCTIAHEYGALFHTDAVQAVGHIPLDVHALEVDMLSASAHKFNGPRGIGFLYVKRGIKLQPFVDGGAQESGHRAGTENTAYIVAMAAALKKNCLSLEENKVKLRKLELRLLHGLHSAGIRFIKNGGKNTLPGLLSLSFPGASGEVLLHRLDLMGIAVSTGSACDSKNTEISHVLKAISLNEEAALGTIRVSLGKYNNEEEIEQIIMALKKVLCS